jgi:glycosyltransferase involved in cell wall biosynthesis
MECLMSSHGRPDAPTDPGAPEARYRDAQGLAAQGEYDRARAVLLALDADGAGATLRAMVRNDLAVLAAVVGDRAGAATWLQAALALDPGCETARANLTVLNDSRPARSGRQPQPVRVAVLSFLFNWPSTGGGNVHTAELTKFLAAAGYDVKHLYAKFDPWRIGQVTEPTPYPAQAVAFSPPEWDARRIVERFRAAVDEFNADWVVLTDSWNMKPLLAGAAGGRPYVLRLQALECLCPLNNVRLLPGADGRPRQCNRHQLATPDACASCVRELEHTSGDLHRVERALAGVGTPEYRDALFEAFADAAAVLAVNPLTAAMVEPYARDVRVVTAGMDPARFPWPFPPERQSPPTPGRLRILFAGLTHEWMKGFHVLVAACNSLWSERQDFEVAVTDAPPADRPAEPWSRYVGWQSQEDLPAQMAGADVVVVPTVAQEALGRTAVEAMAAGKPVVACRIGGLPFTVTDGATGLLCEPNDPADLAAKLATLLDAPELRDRLGLAGRRRFEEHYAWPAIIERHYRPLLQHRSAPPGGPPDSGTKPTEYPSEPTAHAGAVGCVLAIRDRDLGALERTLQTYRWQTVGSVDQVLLDYGSAPEFSAAYRDLCARYGWRLVRVEPAEPRWHLADAYNRAVAALSPEVEVLFKSDADVLLGPEVLAIAGRTGRTAYCQFQFTDLPAHARYPGALSDPCELHEILRAAGGGEARLGDGLFACPADWFRRVGGFDLAFRSWGYEDSDLRVRASRALPVAVVESHQTLLLHQWHPPAPDAGGAGNRAYYKRMQASGEVVRNGGQLTPGARVPAAPRRRKVVVATRSMSPELFNLSGEFLAFDAGEPSDRVRVTDSGPVDYFRRIATLDADWVVNIDEDAFLLDPPGLLALIRRMEEGGYAACGMPDGGVVPIRAHNPAACNAFFNAFDLRRCRRAWADWGRVAGLRHRPEYERFVAPFARQSPLAFDDFEPYYGVFFSLLEAGERILPLEAETWRDGVSTLVRGPGGPLLLHAWYARDWARDSETRRRYERVIAHARAYRAARSGGGGPPLPEVPDSVLAKTLVCLIVHDRVRNVERWLGAWHKSERGPARLAVVHNQDHPDAAATRAIAAARPDAYLPRENVGFDIGAFQDVVRGRFAPHLPDWEYLLWCTDDFLPVRPDFLLQFLAKAADPRVGLVAGRYGYWPGHWSGRESERHCRTVGFLIRRQVASELRFPAERVRTREECLRFEHRPGHMMEQVLARGHRVVELGDPDARVMWDVNHEAELDRWAAFDRHFGDPEAPTRGSEEVVAR